MCVAASVCVYASVCVLLRACACACACRSPYAHLQSTAACSFSGPKQFFLVESGGAKQHFQQAAIYLRDDNIRASGSRQNVCSAEASLLGATQRMQKCNNEAAAIK